jgi:heme-degrading monooxygenase HmoA
MAGPRPSITRRSLYGLFPQQGFELRALPGFLGAYLSKRPIGDRIEFLVLTRWQSLDAIRAFAATDPEKAVVEPGAVAALVDFDATVQHYEVLEDAS